MADCDGGPRGPDIRRAQAAPHCGAKTRKGGKCKRPAMPNGRCRTHGGIGTGPRTAGTLPACELEAWAAVAGRIRTAEEGSG